MRTEADGTVTIGITDHAQEALGDLVFIELPAVGRALEGGRGLRGRRVGEGGQRRLRADRRRSGGRERGGDRPRRNRSTRTPTPRGCSASSPRSRRARRHARRRGVRETDQHEAPMQAQIDRADGARGRRRRSPRATSARRRDEQAAMLALLGYESRAALMDAIVPPAIREQAPLPLAGPADAKPRRSPSCAAIAARNRVMKSFIGQGYYGTHTPGVILRNILENPAWYTAYTPYQPEISQGRLEALVNFQTMVCDLTGMAIANASMLDEATAAAEAMTLALRMGKSASRRFFVADDVFAQTHRRRAHARRAARHRRSSSARAAKPPTADAFAVLLQYPGANGDVRDYRALAAQLHARGALVIVAADILALTLLAPPGEWGADAVVGSSQRFGVPMGYGGPHAGVPRHARRVQALAAGAPRRRHRRRARRSRVPPRAADARAAHPPREGDVEHLHGAGAARGHREHVRRVSRPGRTDAHRAPRASADRDPARGPRAARLRRADAARTSTRSSSPPAQRTARDRRAQRRGRHELPPRRATASLGISLDETTTRDDVEAHLAHVRRRAARRSPSTDIDAAIGDATARSAAAHDAVPHASRVQPLSLRDRDAALPAPARRPRSRARPLDDPARLVHDEAQRDVRDDPGDVARVRRAASVRAGGPGGRLSHDDRASSSRCCARSPATTRCRCSPTRDRRANTRACS